MASIMSSTAQIHSELPPVTDAPHVTKNLKDSAVSSFYETVWIDLFIYILKYVWNLIK
jgi:hypothetical protein